MARTSKQLDSQAIADMASALAYLQEAENGLAGDTACTLSFDRADRFDQIIADQRDLQDRAEYDGVVLAAGHLSFGWKRAGRPIALLLPKKWQAALKTAGITGGETTGLATLSDAVSTALQQGIDTLAEPSEPNEYQKAILDAVFLTPAATGKSRKKAKKTKAAKAARSQGSASQAARDTGESEAAAKPPTPFRGTPDQLRELDKHVINLRAGRLSSGGTDQTTHADLVRLADRIVEKCSGDGGPRDVVFWAHGGLVNEQNALAYAWNNRRWWLDNGIYPVFFVWETGGLETIRQMIDAALVGRRTRAITDPTDWLIEKICRLGRGIWGAMKAHAQLSSSPLADGGAHAFAQLLAERAGGLAGVKFHAVGHSAGSIFHSHFVPALETVFGASQAELDLASLQFLAPAVTVEDYWRLLHPIADRENVAFTTFTMDRRHELADNCFGVYRKSLLYLVSRAFEERRDEAIFGLEESLFGDDPLAEQVARRFREGDPSFALVLGPTGTDAPSHTQTRSTSHGGFDNDAATMMSVAERIAGKPPTQYLDFGQRDLAPVDNRLFDLLTGADIGPASIALPPQLQALATSPAAGQLPIAVSTGSKILLSIGINEFPGNAALNGCVQDSHDWVATFKAFGFETRQLLDAEATGRRLRDEFRRLVDTASNGDMIAIHMSSHGTQVYDSDADEPDTSPYDEALVCHDLDSIDGLIVDDELWEIFSTVRPGVALTTIFDLCHSGNGVRMLLRGNQAALLRRAKARFLRLPSRMIGPAHANRPNARSGSQAETKPLRHLEIAACQPNQKALELDGQGIFTRHAAPILARLGPVGNAGQFQQAVRESFGADFLSTQEPWLDGPAGWENDPLFAPAK